MCWKQLPMWLDEFEIYLDELAAAVAAADVDAVDAAVARVIVAAVFVSAAKAIANRVLVFFVADIEVVAVVWVVAAQVVEVSVFAAANARQLRTTIVAAVGGKDLQTVAVERAAADGTNAFDRQTSDNIDQEVEAAVEGGLPSLTSQSTMRRSTDHCRS